MKINEEEAENGLSLKKHRSVPIRFTETHTYALRYTYAQVTREKIYTKLLGRTQYNAYLLKTVTSGHGYLRLFKGFNQPSKYPKEKIDFLHFALTSQGYLTVHESCCE